MNAAASMPTPTASRTASPRSVASLVLGVLGLAAFGLLSPFAWWLGSAEIGEIRRHGHDPASEPLARIGQVLGIIGTVLIAPAIFVAGALAFGLAAFFWFALFSI